MEVGGNTPPRVHHIDYSCTFGDKCCYILECPFRSESLLGVLNQEAGDEVLGHLRDPVELGLVKIELRPGDIAGS